MTLLPRHFALRSGKGQKCHLCVRNKLLPLSREGTSRGRRARPLFTSGPRGGWFACPRVESRSSRQPSPRVASPAPKNRHVSSLPIPRAADARTAQSRIGRRRQASCAECDLLPNRPKFQPVCAAERTGSYESRSVAGASRPDGGRDFRCVARSMAHWRFLRRLGSATRLRFPHLVRARYRG